MTLFAVAKYMLLLISAVPKICSQSTEVSERVLCDMRREACAGIRPPEGVWPGYHGDV